ncbi:hypothetical protein A4X09_0g4833 [Tilletia walkeri]|uniref:Uncharacterized protein n=1 Tax=Tilletia walkeri TaxID=117179 RepID=A0A8X7N8K7_9BASI|nr:hypothetical protein A4X09_0g4833 [Tilletia walkeri]
MLSSAHSVAAPSRPRPPGSGRKSKTFPAHSTTTHQSHHQSPLPPLAPGSGIASLELPADALATSTPSRASSMPPPADMMSSSPSQQRTLQPSRSRLLNVFGTETTSSNAQWSDESRPGTPKLTRAKTTSLTSPTTDEQFSALINVALANMATRSSASNDTPTSSPAPSSKIVAQLGGEGIDADHIGGLSREELEQLLVAANRKIMERERDIAIAAQIGRTLVEKHDSIKEKHDHILRALVTSSNPRLGGVNLEEEGVVEIRPPKYTPPSNDSTDYFGTHDQERGGGQQQQQQVTSSSYADTSYERHSTDSSSSRLSHRKSMGSAAAVYMQQQLEELEVRNDDLYVEVEALRSKAEQDKRQDSERLRSIQREMEALKAELSMAYTRNAELEEVARREDERKKVHGTEAWKKRVLGSSVGQRKTGEWWMDATAQSSPIKILVQRAGSGASGDEGDVGNDSGLADRSWDSGVGSHRMMEEEGEEGEAEQNVEPDDDDDDDQENARPGNDDLEAANQSASQKEMDDHERALVAQLLAKVRELEEANAAISARAKEFGDRAGRAFEQGERIKDGYEAVESASRLENLGGEEDEEDAVEGNGEERADQSREATRGARDADGSNVGDSSSTSMGVKGGSPSSTLAQQLLQQQQQHALLLRRRAPGNRYAIEGRRTVRSAIRREKAALAELLLAQGGISPVAEGETTPTPQTQALAQAQLQSQGQSQQQMMMMLPNSMSISSISSFNSSLGSLRASSSESSFNHQPKDGGLNSQDNSVRASPNAAPMLKTRKSALMLSRPKIRITPSCEDMAAAREEEARQKMGGWEDEPLGGGGSSRMPAAAEVDILPPLAGVGMGLPSTRSLRRIASEGVLLGGDDSGSFTTSRKRSTARRRSRAQQQQAAIAEDQMTPSSSFNSGAAFPSRGSMGSDVFGELNGLTLGSELGNSSRLFDGGEEESPSRQKLAVQPSGNGGTSSSTPNTPLKYRRPRRTQSSMTLSVNNGATDDEDALSDIAELRFSVQGSPSVERSLDTMGLTPSASRVDFGQELTILGGSLDQKLQLECSPASDGVWRGEQPVVPRGALRDGEMTQYSAYDLLERAADHHPVSWADDEDFGRPITEGEARRLKLLEDGRARAGTAGTKGGLLGWLQPIPKRKKRNQGALQSAGPSNIMGEIESPQQIEERKQMSELLRHKRLAALQRSAAAKRGSGYDLSPSGYRSSRAAHFGGGGHEADGEEEDDPEEEEDELEARALAFSPSRQRRVKRLSLHGLPPSGEELLVPGALRKRRSNSKMREIPESFRHREMEEQQDERELFYGGGGRGRNGGSGPSSSSGRPRPHRKLSTHSLSAYSDGGDEEQEQNQLSGMPGSLQPRRSRSATTDGNEYPVEMYGRYGPSMVQQRVKVASNEVVTLISTWALFATVTMFAFVVAFSRGPRRVLGTPSSEVVTRPRRNA